MHNVTQRTIAENNMIAAGKLALIAATNQPDHGDCDSDGSIEPVPFSLTGEGPFQAGGGYLPTEIGAARKDPWNNIYGYCSWDHGSVIKNGACAEDAGGNGALDYIQQLSAGAVNFLSNIALGDRWISVDGDNEGIFVDTHGNVGIGTKNTFQFGGPDTKTLTIEAENTTRTGSPNFELSRPVDSLPAYAEVFAIRGMTGSTPDQISAITSNILITDIGSGDLGFWIGNGKCLLRFVRPQPENRY